ncbi:MCE family protein [Gordonia sp. NB41Y]|uniref:MCE family protein n=1 Tax=Gordonia sp. NB41Y TaxID=875808 RepID=UPI0006B20126|nr:MCE family protein [Gordonia sp. NB41Y]EMP14306.2 mammalian cell entry protein [Gordonia sp. NB41Y]WLP89249.1 MCE family protein [Gordonia sp. NB41Y]
MDNRARAFRATVIKLGAFAVVMVLVFIGLVVVFSNYRGGGSDGYKAIFTSASQIKSGSKVKIAGVEVGTVKNVSLTRDNQALVGFSVDDKYTLPSSVRALIRYQNLTGDRYLELTQGAADPGETLSAGDTIPETQTEPALDLDKLLGGFKPLFRTLNPNEVNELSASLVEVFQGQGGALNKLLADTSSFTNALADRDQLIGSVIDNLNDLLGTLDGDRKGLDTSLDQMQLLISGLSAQRGTIGNAISETAETTEGLADLLADTRPALKSTLTSIGVASDNVVQAEPFLRSLLPRLPNDYKMLSNLGSYGAWLQIYFCRIRLLLSGPDGKQYFFTSNDVMGDKTKAGGRCSYPS